MEKKEPRALSMRQEQVESQHQRQEPSLLLSIAHQRRLAMKWDRMLSDPKFLFIPRELRGQVDPEEALLQTRLVGEFAANYFKEELVKKRGGAEDIANRILRMKKIMAVGYGRGYDSLWLKEAALAGYAVWWLDVSSVAVLDAREDITRQYITTLREMRESGKVGAIPDLPTIRQAEIRSALLEPENIGLKNLFTVDGWYLCRVVGCLSRRSARIVLQTIGESLGRSLNPATSNIVVIIEPLKDYNPGQADLLSEKMIQSNLQLGARRRVKIERRAFHHYRTRVYAALTLTIMAG